MATVAGVGRFSVAVSTVAGVGSCWGSLRLVGAGESGRGLVLVMQRSRGGPGAEVVAAVWSWCDAGVAGLGSIGPQDVLATLLNNLKVQKRQNRVCTTVAIAVVVETCSPSTILPALMNEDHVPELNVQNGDLISLSFLFEYIGEMGKGYIYAVTPLLEDALMDRDLVHRQTTASAVKNMALGVAGLGCEDALKHLLNYVWPNIFETSPHVINAVMEAMEGMRVALGAAAVLNYCL
ncbi:uncharacterized protein LOC131156084 [Malania oleifera]|uniref:uncharacterized protein LOC131156084 n=1 Tax=Malania oleifera TaxID=397392 RepID=UPI0025AE612B|nr:uncharacterized protein LOC131156084 [Malania oleifera]